GRYDELRSTAFKELRHADGLDRVVEKILQIVDPASAHLTQNRLTVSVNPKDFQIHSGQWAKKVPVRVSNPTGRDLHKVWLKLTFSKTIVETGSVAVDSGVLTTALAGRVAGVEMKADVVVYDCLDAEGRQALY